MSYKFKKISYSADGIDPLWQYGVKDLDKSIEALEQIESWAWTPEEIQSLIDQSKALQGNERVEYSVEGGYLLIIVTKENAFFYDLVNSTNEYEDFKWTFEEFIKFLEDFKKFVAENS